MVAEGTVESVGVEEHGGDSEHDEPGSRGSMAQNQEPETTSKSLLLVPSSISLTDILQPSQIAMPSGGKLQNKLGRGALQSKP